MPVRVGVSQCRPSRGKHFPEGANISAPIKVRKFFFDQCISIGETLIEIHWSKKKFARTYRKKVICPFRGANLLLVSTVFFIMTDKNLKCPAKKKTMVRRSKYQV